jgi:hypothetical protein
VELRVGIPREWALWSDILDEEKFIDLFGCARVDLNIPIVIIVEVLD